MPKPAKPPRRLAKDYAGGGTDAEQSPNANSEEGSPLRGMTEGDMGRYGTSGNPPVKTLEKPDRDWRKVAGGGSPGAVQAKKKSPRTVR